MAYSSAERLAPVASVGTRTPLNRQQIVGFWAAWFGLMLDGMDSVIYALVFGPALTELLPRSGIEATPANIGYAGSLMFGLFLIGWGLSFIWGPISDKFSRTKAIAATVLVYAVFTGAAAFAPNVWMLAIFRFLAGIGVGGEWAMAGTYVAEAWPEDRRKMGAGYFHTGYYFGFFVAAGLNYTIGAAFGWRAMFLCGLFPVVVWIATLLGVKEPERWEHKHQEEQEGRFFVGAWPIHNGSEFRAFLDENLGSTASRAMRIYAPNTDEDIFNALSYVFGDTQFNYGSREQSKVQPKTFRYLFTRAPLGEPPPPTHTEELAYVFGNLSAPRIVNRSGVDTNDRSLSAEIMEAWVRFAATGDPNGGNLPLWPRYDAASDNYLEFGDSIIAKTGYRSGYLDFVQDYFDGKPAK